MLSPSQHSIYYGLQETAVPDCCTNNIERFSETVDHIMGTQVLFPLEPKLLFLFFSFPSLGESQEINIRNLTKFSMFMVRGRD